MSDLEAEDEQATQLAVFPPRPNPPPRPTTPPRQPRLAPEKDLLPWSPLADDLNCQVCKASLLLMTHEARERHVNACLDKSGASATDSNKDAVGDDFQERFKCAVCDKDITRFNAQRRLQHMNNCVDSKEKVDKKPAAVNVASAAVDAAPAPVLQVSDIQGAFYQCIVCRKDMTRVKPPARVNHVKECAKKRGLTLANMESLAGEQRKRQTGERPTGVKKETRSKFFATGNASDDRDDPPAKAKAKASAKRSAAPALSIEEADILSIAKVASMTEAARVANERRQAELDAPPPRLPPAEAVQRAFRSHSHSEDPDFVSATPVLAPSVLQTTARGRTSLFELSTGKGITKVSAAVASVVTSVAPVPPLPVPPAPAPASAPASAPAPFVPAAAAHPGTDERRVPADASEKGEQRLATRLDELMDDEPLQPSPTDRTASHTEHNKGAAPAAGKAGAGAPLPPAPALDAPKDGQRGAASTAAAPPPPPARQAMDVIEPTSNAPRFVPPPPPPPLAPVAAVATKPPAAEDVARPPPAAAASAVVAAPATNEKEVDREANKRDRDRGDPDRERGSEMASEEEAHDSDDLPEATYSPLLNFDATTNWNDSVVVDDGPARANAEHKDDAPIVQQSQHSQLSQPSRPPPVHKQPPRQAAIAAPDANAQQVYVARCAEIRDIYVEKLNQLKTWYYAEIGRAALERDRLFVPAVDQPMGASPLPSASPSRAPPPLPGPLSHAPPHHQGGGGGGHGNVNGPGGNSNPSSGAALPQEDLQALFEALTPSAFVPPLPPSPAPSQPAPVPKSKPPAVAEPLASLPKANSKSKTKSTPPVAAPPAPAAAGGGSAPNYSSWTAEALEAMSAAQMAAKLTEIWNYMHTAHSPAPVVPRPSAKAAAAAAAAPAAAKELSEEERQLEERITAALKALPLWSDVLQYKLIDVKELKSRLLEAGVKVTKPVLAAYCDRQGVQYTGMNKRKPGAHF